MRVAVHLLHETILLRASEKIHTTNHHCTHSRRTDGVGAILLATITRFAALGPLTKPTQAWCDALMLIALLFL
jgi:hypothetical protein